MNIRCAAVAIATVIWVALPGARQQSSDPPSLPPYITELLAQPIPIYQVGLGSFSRKISSRSAEAQAYFDQGFQLMYAFAKYDAIRSFREAE
jgi:hypothetical protein